jgi:hypothetical protein
MNQEIPLYTGQLIKKNFRFEIWNTSQGVASFSSAVNFYTSVLNPIDYRYAQDSALIGSDPVCTNFKNDSSTTFQEAVYPDHNGIIIPPLTVVQIPFPFAMNHGYTYNFVTNDLQLDNTPAVPSGPNIFGNSGYVSIGLDDSQYNNTIWYIYNFSVFTQYTVQHMIEDTTVASTYIYTLPLTFPANAISVTN